MIKRHAKRKPGWRPPEPPQAPQFVFPPLPLALPAPKVRNAVEIAYVKDNARQRFYKVVIDRIGRVLLFDVEVPSRPPMIVSQAILLQENRFTELAEVASTLVKK